ncbi:condensation domain-containing protein [Streptosporangium sp. NPDC048047]|uniref:condensation domain-containing protein n=1 Tax=Streptosporangium sp. NPDC048047 TaxID=3155748 RepID=UPI0034195E5A
MTPAERHEALRRSLASLPPARREALRRSLAGRAGGTDEAEAGPAWPLSFGQERLWFLSRFDPSDTGSNIIWPVRLRGPVDPGGLAAAFTRIAERHRVLRARFVQRDGRPVQIVTPPRPVPLEQIDLTGETEESEAEAVARYAGRPFDLRSDPPIRTALMWREPGGHALLCIGLHHIAADGWSLNVLMGELAECYAAHREGRPDRLDDLPAQYTDFVTWERERFEREGARHTAYWTRALAGVPALDLPADHPRPARWGGRAARVAVAVPDADLAGLERFAVAERHTLFMALLAAFQAALWQASGQTDFCVGVPVAGQGRTEFSALIGDFSNTLAMRADLSGDPSFRTLLRRVRRTVFGALQHAEAPFERVVAAVSPSRDLRRPPLCQALFNLTHNLPTDALLRTSMADLRVEALPQPPFGRTRAEVSAQLFRDERGLGGFLEYDGDLFEAGTARRLTEAFTGLVRRAATDPDTPLPTPAHGGT